MENASFIIWRLHSDRGRRQECQNESCSIWALGEIGDEQAIGPLIEALRDKNSDVRVSAISALEKLGAVAALPHLHALLNDHEKTHYGAQISVAEAAKAAIAALETKR